MQALRKRQKKISSAERAESKGAPGGLECGAQVAAQDSVGALLAGPRTFRTSAAAAIPFRSCTRKCRPTFHHAAPCLGARLVQAALWMSETVALVLRSRASSAALAAWLAWVRAVALAWAAARVAPS